MKKIILIILILNFNILNAGGWVSGNELVKYMNENKKLSNGIKNVDTIDALRFNAYVFGVIDVLEDAEYICIPENVNGRQLFAIVIKYIDNNPDKWNKTASYLVETPLLNTFPCKKKK